MKAATQISKSAVMSRAWKIFKRNRDMFPTFSEALTRAWAVEKANIEYNKKQVEEAEFIERYKRVQAERKNVKVQVTPEMAESLINYYSRSGVYFGD